MPKTIPPFFIYSPIGRTGSTLLTAWTERSPDVGGNAQERTYLFGAMVKTFTTMNKKEQEYYLRREPVEAFFRLAIEAYRLDPTKAIGIKIHEIGVIGFIHRIFPNAKILHSRRDRDAQFASKAEQMLAMQNHVLDRATFDAMAAMEDVEIADLPHQPVQYEALPDEMPTVFEYLGIAPVGVDPAEMRKTYAARTFSSRKVNTDATGWVDTSGKRR